MNKKKHIFTHEELIKVNENLNYDLFILEEKITRLEATINDMAEKSYKAGYSTSVEDLVEALNKWLKAHPKAV